MSLRARLSMATAAGLALAVALQASAHGAPIGQQQATEAQIRQLIDPSVEEHLRAVTAALPDAKVVQTLRGRLAPGAIQRVNVKAQTGIWHFAAVCDDNCDDINMRMLAADGQVAYLDVAPDKFPSTRAEVQGEIDFVLEIAMKACSKETCVWAAQFYVKTPPAK
jgi:hypothetical protein